MVSMRYVDQSAFPTFTTYVKKDLPKVRDKPRVWRAFLKYAEYDKRWLGSKWATFAFAWGTEPRIIVKELDGAYGKFIPKSGTYNIFISQDLVGRFELDYRRADAKLLVEATILHEMVHWADRKDGELQLKAAGKEAGREFEKAAYGRVIGRWWKPGE